MAGPKYFDNQIIKVQNLEFQRDSFEKNVVDNFLSFTKNMGGVTTGLNVYSGTGLVVNVSPGVAYDNNGQRMELYSGISFVATSGMVWATLVQSDYNPDPASEYASFPAFNTAQVNINPITGSGVNVSTFNVMIVNQTSGVGSIPLARVNATNTNISSIDLVDPYRQDLKLLGVLNVNTSSLNGAILQNNTVDSDKFTHPLHYDFSVSGINITNTVSGVGSIGTPSSPFNSISTKTLNVTNISGLSPVHMKNALFMDAFSGNSIISVEGSGYLRLNPSGQDVIIGGDIPSQQGRLWTNHISPRYAVPGANFPTLAIDNAAIINMVANGVPDSSTPALNILAGHGININQTGGTGSYGICISGNRVFLASNPRLYATPNYGASIDLNSTNITQTAFGITVNAFSPSGSGSYIVNTKDLQLNSDNISIIPNAGVNNRIIIPSGALITNINYDKTMQGHSNLIPNPDFSASNSVGNAVMSGTMPYPEGWVFDYSNPSKTYTGPFLKNTTSADETLSYYAFPTQLNEKLQGLNQFTIEFQFKLNSYTSCDGAKYNNIWTQGDVSVGGSIPRIEIFGNNVSDAVLFFYINGSRVQSNPITDPINLGQWYNGTVTVSGSTGYFECNLFIDNKRVAPATNINGSVPFLGTGNDYIVNSIGAFTNGASAPASLFNGYLSNFRITDAALPSGTFASGLTYAQPSVSNGNVICDYRFRNNIQDTYYNGYDLLQMGKSVSLWNLYDRESTDVILKTKFDDASVLDTGNDYFMEVNLTNLDISGVSIYSPLRDVKPNTVYTLSYWYNNNGTQIRHINGIQSAAVLYGNGDFANSNSTWVKNVLRVRTASGVSSPKFGINFSSVFGTIPTSKIYITGVQVTEGYAELPQIRTYPRTLIAKTSRQYQILNTKWNTVNNMKFDNIITTGGKIKIDFSGYIIQGATSSSFFKILVDGKEVTSKPCRFGANGGSTIYVTHDMTWEGYIDGGSHTFNVIARCDAANIAAINGDPQYGAPTTYFTVKEL